MFQELKKLFSSRWILLITGLFLGLMAWTAHRPFRDYKPDAEDRAMEEAYAWMLEDIRSWNAAPEVLQAELSERITKLQQRIDNAADASQLSGEYSDYAEVELMLYRRAQSLAEYTMSTFDLNRKKLLITHLKHLIVEERDGLQDTYLFRARTKLLERYNRRFEMHLMDVGQPTYYSYYNFCATDYLMMILVLLMTVRMFSVDEQMKSRPMIATTVRGRKKLFLSEFGTVTFLACLLVTLLAATELVAAVRLFGLKNLNQPIQMYRKMEMCPFLISIGEYLLFKYLCRLLLYLCLCAVTAAITIAIHRPFVSDAVSMIGVFVPLYVFQMAKNGQSRGNLTALYQSLRSVLPQSFLDIDPYLTSFDYVNVFGQPIPRLAVVISVTGAVTIAGFLGGLCLFGRARKKGV